MKRVSTALSSWPSECSVGLTAEDEERGKNTRHEKRNRTSAGKGNLKVERRKVKKC